MKQELGALETTLWMKDQLGLRKHGKNHESL
jgi:hypothetical protein